MLGRGQTQEAAGARGQKEGRCSVGGADRLGRFPRLLNARGFGATLLREMPNAESQPVLLAVIRDDAGLSVDVAQEAISGSELGYRVHVS